MATGEISYINLNGEVRPIAGASIKQDLEATVNSQNKIIAELNSQLEDIQTSLTETKNGYTALVKSLKSASILEQTPEGFSVKIEKPVYVLSLSQGEEKKTVSIKLYKDGQLATDSVSYYVVIFGIKNGTSFRLNEDLGNLLQEDGTLNFSYTADVDSILCNIYNSKDYKELVATNTINIATAPQGIYSVDIVCNEGSFVKDDDGTITIVCTLLRNGQSIKEEVINFLNKYSISLLYTLSWNNIDGNMSNSSNATGVFSFLKSALSDVTQFSCVVDNIPVESLEKEVFANG